MRHEHYPFSSDEEGCYFEFESTGPKGVIKKVVSFDYVSDQIWNLAFGDKIGDSWTDNLVSNNNDLVRIMATVIAAAMEFSRLYPDRFIRIRPLDERRKRLYNAVFQRNIEEIATVFDVLGQSDKSMTRYDPSQFYDQFFVFRKKPNFVKK